MREREVESHLGNSVKHFGGLCLKFDPSLENGMPDRLVVMPGGVSVWVETKKPVGGVLSSMQKHQHKRLRALGQRVEVVWTKEQADRLVAELTLPRT